MTEPSPAATAAAINASIWHSLYADGRNDLRYPNEALVRLAARYLGAGPRVRILDYGFGTGANLVHLAGMGHELHGVEVSAAAVERTRARVQAAGLQAQLALVEPGAKLPYPAASFDCVVAWQVLYYNDLEGWAATLCELERVARPAARVLIATAAPGDTSQVHADPLGGGVYRSRVPGQEGCIVTIPGREDLATLFPQRELEVGEFGHDFGGVRSRHWLLTYTVPAP